MACPLSLSRQDNLCWVVGPVGQRSSIFLRRKSQLVPAQWTQPACFLGTAVGSVPETLESPEIGSFPDAATQNLSRLDAGQYAVLRLGVESLCRPSGGILPSGFLSASPKPGFGAGVSLYCHGVRWGHFETFWHHVTNSSTF